MSLTNPAGAKQDVLHLGAYFEVQIKAPINISGYFSEASGLSIEMDTIDNKTVTDKGLPMTRKMPVSAKYGELTLKRPLSKDKSFWNWAMKVAEGKDYRCATGAIIMLGRDFKPMGSWEFTNGWVSKWSASDLDAGSTDLMMETVVIAIEMLEKKD
jgi:phage tail-like protein